MRLGNGLGIPFLKSRTRSLAYFFTLRDALPIWGLLGPKTRVSAAHSRFKPSQCPRQARRPGNGLGMPFLKTRTRYLAYFSSYGDLGAFWGLFGPKNRVSAAHSRFKPFQCPRQARRHGNGLGNPFLKNRTLFLAYLST